MFNEILIPHIQYRDNRLIYIVNEDISYIMQTKETSSINYCFKLMIKFSFYILKNLIRFDLVEMRHRNCIIGSIILFWA